MPTNAKRSRPVLVDTSVAVALIVSDHVSHDIVTASLRGERLGLAGHAFFETYSVLTRLPPPSRRSPADVSDLLEHNFPESRYLDTEQIAELARRLGGLGISGGSVYDALVGAAAAYHGLSLATRDRRAFATYRALEVSFRPIE